MMWYGVQVVPRHLRSLPYLNLQMIVGSALIKGMQFILHGFVVTQPAGACGTLAAIGPVYLHVPTAYPETHENLVRALWWYSFRIHACFVPLVGGAPI